MLRSLLRGVDGGLFAEHAWLKCGGAATRLLAAPGGAALDTAASLETMLADEKFAALPGRQLGLIISDRLARVVALPWQASLAGLHDLEPYARACFEHSALALDNSWAMQIQRRHRGALGLAYALPLGLLDALSAVASSHRLRLVSVMPVSAVAYAMSSRPTGEQHSAVILHEATRVTALSFDRVGLCGYTAEPVATESSQAALRLIKRVAMTRSLSDVQYWSSADDGGAGAAHIAATLADTRVAMLPPGHWSEP